MKILLFLLSLVLSGCHYSGGAYQNNNFDVFKLRLLQSITVPEGSSYAYVIAPGKIVKRNEINNNELYCKFSIPRSKDSDALIITADVFKIRHIYRRAPNASYLPLSKQFAYRNQYSGFFNHHDVSRQDMELHFELTSETQPHVKSMSCIRFSDPFLENVPTIGEAQDVIRGLAEFES